MVEILGHGEFFSGELELVPEFRDPVMLKSGGPIMEVLSVDSSGALCEWEDGRETFPVACLYRLVAY